MLLKYNYWYFSKAISKKICNKIITHGKKQINLSDSKIEYGKINKKIRDCKTSFFSDVWIYDILWPYLHSANKSAGWNFDINYCEPLQFGIYKNKGHYDWHQDTMEDDTPPIRKLSLSLILNDSSEFIGGEFKFSINRKSHVVNELKDAGSIIIFPSFLYHKVLPVTNGSRYSLVGWFKGPKFK
jgi:PKHD-type hydroxylase